MAMKGRCRALILVLAMFSIVSCGKSALVTNTSTATGECRRRCGDVDIPYPFGVIEDPPHCYREPGFFYGLVCNRTFNPAKPFVGTASLTSISLYTGELRLAIYVSYMCYSGYGEGPGVLWDIDLNRIPAAFSTKNVFTAVGCDTLAVIKGRLGQNYTGGCMSMCEKTSNITDGWCSGIGCCEAAIPFGLKRYQTGFSSFNNHHGILDFNNCSYAFMVERGNYTFRAQDLAGMDSKRTFPVTIDWYIGEQRCQEAKRNASAYACVSASSECFDSLNGPGYICNCSAGYEGNPYIRGGCQDVDECKLGRDQYPCFGICNNTQGDYACTCPKGTNSKDPKKEKCMPYPKSHLPPFVYWLTGSALSLIVIALIGLITSWAWIQSNQQKYYKLYGGPMLQSFLSSSDISNTFMIFSEKQLKKATNNFEKSHIIGEGGNGTVYIGKLCETTVAIKKPKHFDKKSKREISQELLILPQVNHKNIVKLLGCCLEVKIPMLVYEYIPDGTLSEYLHKRIREPFPFTWRLKIAKEVACALSYLHNYASPPIYHGDVKSANILLEYIDREKMYKAKVSDFGLSILVQNGIYEHNTLAGGTYGYIDPEYLQTMQLTAKSDVYSFGVVLAELLTRRIPFNLQGEEEETCLAWKFVACLERGTLNDILDPEIMREGISAELEKFAKISWECLNMKGYKRPTMPEVVQKLEALHSSDETNPFPSTTKDDLQDLVTEPTSGSLFHDSHSYGSYYTGEPAYDLLKGR